MYFVGSVDVNAHVVVVELADDEAMRPYWEAEIAKVSHQLIGVGLFELESGGRLRPREAVMSGDDADADRFIDACYPAVRLVAAGSVP